ncbi:MAG: TraB/GumN family protein [Cyclobacteriaceae bacterium]
MRILRLALFPIILTFILTPGFSQNSILWEVSGNDLPHSSFLLGSLKFIGEKEYILHNEINDKLKDSKLFAIEDEVNHHAQHELNKAIHFAKGQSLHDVLTADEYKRVESFFESEFNISKKKFSKKYANLKPLALSITMTRLALHEDVKFYDIELLKLANDLRIPTYSLEPIEREAEAFNAFPVETQATALMHSIDNFPNQKTEYEKLEEAYAEGDIDRVFEYSLHPFEKNELFIEEFYYKRNEEWLPKLEKMFSESKSFVTVGVTHLKGERGLLNLLRSKGYTVTPIPVTD